MSYGPYLNSMPDEDTERDEIRKINKTIDEFATAMKRKMLIKRAEGRSGWDDVRNLQSIRNGLKEHIEKQNTVKFGQEVDIANFAMMIWNLNR